MEQGLLRFLRLVYFMKETINILCKHKLFRGMHKELFAKEECKQ